MPVEINELIIRANVVSTQGGASVSATVSTEDNQKMQQMLDDILKKLKDKDER